MLLLPNKLSCRLSLVAGLPRKPPPLGGFLTQWQKHKACEMASWIGMSWGCPKVCMTKRNWNISIHKNKGIHWEVLDNQLHFPGGSGMKNPPAMQEAQAMWVLTLGGEDPLEEGMAPPTLAFLPGEPHGERSLAGYSPWGRRESGTPEVTEHASTLPGI